MKVSVLKQTVLEINKIERFCHQVERTVDLDLDRRKIGVKIDPEGDIVRGTEERGEDRPVAILQEEGTTNRGVFILRSFEWCRPIANKRREKGGGLQLVMVRLLQEEQVMTQKTPK